MPWAHPVALHRTQPLCAHVTQAHGILTALLRRKQVPHASRMHACSRKQVPHARQRCCNQHASTRMPEGAAMQRPRQHEVHDVQKRKTCQKGPQPRLRRCALRGWPAAPALHERMMHECMHACTHA
jgi:hypothetical protein